MTCPDCHAENEEGAQSCQACGRALPQAEANGALPPWLQQLKPEGEDVALEVVAASAGKSAAASGTDGLFAPQPPKGNKRGKQAANREKPDADGGKGASVETASLISEDDLPGWLRAFGDAESKHKAATTTDESWMVGAEAEAAAPGATGPNLAQSWQSPARPAEARARTGAASIFGKPAESAAKPERVIATPVAPAPAPAPEPEPAPRASNLRPDLPRPRPQPRQQGGMSLQRAALIAFVAALLIFLVVVGIFLIGPAIG